MGLLSGKQKNAEAGFQQSVERLEAWHGQAVGQAVLASQQALLGQYLETLFGYYLLQLGVSREVSITESGPIKHHFALHPLDGEQIDGRFDNTALPVATESVDVVIVHHLLSYIDDPHSLLREIHRVIIPSGRVIIVGFNPYSFLGVQTWLGARFGYGLQQKHLFSVPRVKDWLKLIDFGLEKVDYGFFKPPLRFFLRSGMAERFDHVCAQKHWPMGAFYIMQAKKLVTPTTRIKKKKEKPKSMIPVMKPSLSPSHKVGKDDE